jgi:transcriptional regulator with XRE-family HTH domain
VELEKRFNARYTGAPVTPQAISGWLSGKYYPKPDKLRVLADLVGTDPQVLLFGDSKGKQSAKDESALPHGISVREKQTISAYLALPPNLREIAADMIAVMTERAARDGRTC